MATDEKVRKRTGATVKGRMEERTLLGKHYVHKGNNSRMNPGCNSGTSRGGKISEG